MKAIKILAVPVVAGCLFLACDEAPVPTDVPDAPAVELQADFLNGPAEAGVVMRYESAWWIQDVFPETPASVAWFVQMGLGPDEHAAGCQSGMLTPFSTHEVDAKKGEQTIYNETNKDAGVTVFLWDDVLQLYIEALGMEGVDPYCYWYERLDPIATGVANLHSSEGPQGWTAVANGMIDYMGDTYRFHWFLKNPYTDKEILKKRIW